MKIVPSTTRIVFEKTSLDASETGIVYPTSSQVVWGKVVASGEYCSDYSVDDIILVNLDYCDNFIFGQPGEGRRTLYVIEKQDVLLKIEE